PGRDQQLPGVAASGGQRGVSGRRTPERIVGDVRRSPAIGAGLRVETPDPGRDRARQRRWRRGAYVETEGRRRGHTGEARAVVEGAQARPIVLEGDDHADTEAVGEPVERRGVERVERAAEERLAVEALHESRDR